MAPLILDLDTRWITGHLLRGPFTFGERSHWSGGWAATTVDLDAVVEKRKKSLAHAGNRTPIHQLSSQ
jgi:hypothetical protein